MRATVAPFGSSRGPGESSPRRPTACLAALLLLGAVAAAAAAAAADGWRAAPLYGADVRTLAFDPLISGRVLAGTSSGQVYESLDSGQRWQPAGARVPLPGWVVSDLAFDPHRSGRVWAALWALWGAEGAVAVSEDGGRTWQWRSEGLPARQIYALALAPDRPGELFAATRQGVWASRDAGETWSRLTADRPEIGKVTSLMIDPYDADVLYAGTWRRAYRSDDRGRTWRGIFDGMVLDSEVFALRPGTGGEGDLWASTCGWVYRGRDRGRVWRRHTNGLAERRTPSFDVLPGGRLLAGTVAGLYSSDDQGSSWRRRSPEVAVTAIAFDPRRPEVVLFGAEGSGVWRSTDGGATFVASATGMVSLRVTDVVTLPLGLALSVRHTERSDGVHGLVESRLAPAATDELPIVLDLAADGSLLYAATEHGVWRRVDGAWQRLEELGDGRYESVAADGEWIVARSRDAVVSLRRSEVRREALVGAGSDLALWDGAVWLVDGGRLWRWDLSERLEVETPGEPVAIDVFGSALVLDTRSGRFRRRAPASWSRLPVAAARLLPTGDEALPILGLWPGGTATLHDERGREHVALRVPVPPRDISASALRGNRLHLATSGYGLLWSHLLEVTDGAEAAATALSSP